MPNFTTTTTIITDRGDTLNASKSLVVADPPSLSVT